MEKLTKILSKSQVIDLFIETKDQIMAGDQDPLKVAVHLKALEELISKLRKDEQIQDYTLEQALKENEKTFNIYGAEISIREMGTKYDFSICNDSLLEGLYNQMTVLKKQIKDRETMLKTIKEDNPVVSLEGEILNRPLKTSKTGLAITLNCLGDRKTHRGYKFKYI